MVQVIEKLRKSVTRGARMNWAGTFFFLGAAVGGITALLGFHSAFGFLILILCFIGFVICKGSEDVANRD
jgi:hypothetical protein